MAFSGTLAVLFTTVIALSSGKSTHLHFSDNYMLMYEIVQNNTLELTIDAPGVTGWVAVGINNASVMDGGDLFMGGFNSTTNTTYKGDYHVGRTGDKRPIYDAEQNWEVTKEATEVNGRTKISVKRPTISPDKNHDIDIQNQTMYLLWSYNKNNDTVTIMHTNNGVCSINFFTGAGECAKFDMDNNGASIISIGISTLLMGLVATVLKY